MVRSVWFRFIYLVVLGVYYLALRRPISAHNYMMSARVTWWLCGPTGGAHAHS